LAGGIRPLCLNRSILRRYAEFRLQLLPIGQLIEDVDTLIGATALEHGLTIVTLDVDFTRVTGLSVRRLTKQQLT
jgi:predicted nucleic acid-binding protein